MQNKFLAFLLLTSVMCSPAFAQTADKNSNQQPTTVQVEPTTEADVLPLPTEDKVVTPEPLSLPTEVDFQKEEVKEPAKETEALPLPTANEVTIPAPVALPTIPQQEANEKTDETTEKQPEIVQVEPAITLDTLPLPTENKAESTTTPSQDKPVQTKPVDDKTPFPGLKKPEAPITDTLKNEVIKDQQNTPTSIENIQAENKRRLEEELKATTLTGKDIVNFPNRSSLGTLELATLPGINETTFNGPLPMAKSVSNKDMPSEQLLGRITPEVFQEMADIERGNTFLKLQVEKEKIKSDLEKLKATYRQQRMDEISKREDVVRTRIGWWQEQEKIRLEIAKKKLEEEALEREIAEQKEMRERLREEAIARQVNTSEETKDEPIEVKEAEVILPSLEELYTIESIRGLSSNLTAVIKDKTTGVIYTIKSGDTLPSGYRVKEIKSDLITGTYGNRVERLVFQVTSK